MDDRTDTDTDEPSGSTEAPSGRPRWFVAIILMGIVAASTAIALLADEQPDRDEAHAPHNVSVEHGSACRDLQTAAARLAADDREAFIEAVKRAGRTAEEALQRSGVTFGPPERLALELSFLVDGDRTGSQRRVQALLSAGVQACASTEPSSGQEAPGLAP